MKKYFLVSVTRDELEPIGETYDTIEEANAAMVSEILDLNRDGIETEEQLEQTDLGDTTYYEKNSYAWTECRQGTVTWKIFEIAC